MAKEKNKKKAVDRYRLTVYNDESFEELRNFRITKLSIFAYLGAVIILIAILTIVLLFYSPLNVLLPNHSNVDLRKNIIENSLKIDSLENNLLAKARYVNQVKVLLQGKVVKDTTSKKIDDRKAPENNENLEYDSNSGLDSIIRARVEQDENKITPSIDNSSSGTNLKNLHFVVPLKGMISDEFNINKKHYGIDIVGNGNEAVLAILPGTIIHADWSLETGHVIQIQHDNDLISMYKHNSVILKKVGDRVVAGESIAISGNSGEMTTGPHLHFELWYKGTPVNPADYIAF